MWRVRGTKSALARWLKAIAKDDFLFSPEAIMDVWRETGDAQAAKVIAYQAPPEFVEAVFAELVNGCSEGWIVKQAGCRSNEIESNTLSIIREKFPATYLYIHFFKGWKLSTAEALDLVEKCETDVIHSPKGLAIWCVGQMGLWDTLERLRNDFITETRGG